MVEESINMTPTSIEESTPSKTDTPTAEVGPEQKKKPSLKEQGMQIIGKVIPNKSRPTKGMKVFDLKRSVSVGNVQLRPFDTYVLGKNWRVHADRLSSDRLKPITTAFAKMVSWDNLKSYMSKITKDIKEKGLREWNKRELQSIDKEPVRGAFYVLMYLTRAIYLYDPDHYPVHKPDPMAFEIPKFTPLKRLDDVEIRSDAKSANVGFPTLENLSQPGEKVTESKVYKTILQDGAIFETEAELSKKETFEVAATLSPPIAVFDRAQSGGRAVFAGPKKVVFPVARIDQPIIKALEDEPWYACGDWEHRLHQMLELLSGNTEYVIIVDGDDVIILLKDGEAAGADASAFESSAFWEEINQILEKVGSHLDSRNAKIYKMGYLSAGAVESVCSVCIIKHVNGHGIKSGYPNTHWVGSGIELNRSAASNRNTFKSWLHDLNCRGIYREEFHGKGFVILAKNYVSLKKATIQGSEVRALNAIWQREDPVIPKRADEADKSEDARMVAILSKIVRSEKAHDIISWVKKQGYRLRTEKDKLLKLGEKRLQKQSSRGEIGKSDWKGKLEREYLAEAIDLLS
jgi:hypothetical protein